MKTQMHDILQSGYELLSNQQEIVFTKYVRLVLPVDGFVFWVKKSLINLSNGAINNFMLNSMDINGSQAINDPSMEFSVKGSLHYTTNNTQENTQTYGKNSVVFTTSTDIDDFNDIGENTLFIGTFKDVQFAFNSRGGWYEEAGLYHYTGDSINPIMRSQLISELNFFDDSKIVNDSLPLFMSRNLFAPVYPAFRGVQNARPPFISVDVQETKPFQQLASEETSEYRQFCLDTVKVTCYGLNNNQILDYIRYMVAEGVKNVDFGICNAPIAKKIDIPQSELNVTANAKEITFEVNYYQTRAAEIALKLIESALSSVSINPILA